MQFQLEQKIGARFKLIARKANNDSIARESEWFNNIVLDTGLARMSVGTWIDRCCVGTGNSTPIATQTALDNFLASTTTLHASTGARQVTTVPYYYSAIVTWRFGEGVAAGNLSEVGLGWNNTNLWNRALIRDANGNPTTMTILSDEYLDVISEIRVYPQQNLSGSFNLLDKTGAVISAHTYIGLPCVFGNGWFNANKVTMGLGSWFYGYTGGIGSTVTEEPSGLLIINNNPSLMYPTPASVRGVATLGLTSGIGAARSLSMRAITIMGGSEHGYKLQIDPPITKTNTQIMTYTFEMSWGRYEGNN